MFYLIGAGGIGCFLAPALSRMVKDPQEICIVDQDTVEKKNLSRQMYTKEHIGENKALILAMSIASQCDQTWFNEGTMIKPNSVLFCCADNIPCRRDTLMVADRTDSVAVIGGNETWSSEAYIYFPKWNGSEYDPRVYYPKLLTVNTGRPDDPCHSAKTDDETPQTIMANMTAANFMVRLYFAWTDDRGRLTWRTKKSKPVHLRAERTILFSALDYKA